MKLIQALLVLAAVGLLFFSLTGRQTHMARAWKKIALALLPLAMIVAVLFPETTNQLAHLVGVGRGADLLLYVMTLAFITYVLNGYVYQQKDRDATYRLARKIALHDAVERYDIHKK